MVAASAVSHCYSGPIELLLVSHCLLYGCWLSLTVSLVHGVTACLSLSPMVAGFLAQSHIWQFSISHCLIYGYWLSLTVLYMVSGRLSMSLRSHGVADCLSLSPIFAGCPSLSPIVASTLSLSLPVPWSCCMSLTVSYSCLLSLTVSPVPCSCWRPLTVSHGCWLSLTVSHSKMELLHVSHLSAMVATLAITHCPSVPWS